jgi:ATP-binding cassette subfamily B protein
MSTSPPQPSLLARMRRRSWHERWQDVRAASANIPRAVRLVWNAHRPATLALLALTLVSAAMPASQAWVGKLVVDTLVTALQTQTPPAEGLRALAPLLVVGFGLVTLGAAVNQGYTLLEHVLNARLSHTINEEIIEKALALDLRYFEDADFYDKLQNARREADYRALTVVNNLFSMLQGVLILASFASILLVVSPLVALVLFCATLPAFIAQAHYGGLYFRLLTWRAPEFRRMQYIEHLLTVDASVKEVKLFGLGRPMLRRYQEMFWRFFREDATLARRRSLISVLWGTLSTGSFYAAYAWVAWRTLAGAMTLGDLTLYLALFQQSQNTFRSLVSGVGKLYEHGLFLENLFTFLRLEPRMSQAAEPHRLPRPICQGIEFRDVSFRYPGTSRWALRTISLHIAPGEKLALVGANGAGKTTLIKLLTRLYDPTEGQILLDGVDLRDYDLRDLHAGISVIFQDFVHYQATVRENIGYGQFDHLHDEARIAAAAQRSGAQSVADMLPLGYDTMLGRWFEGGHELSGGEWQKLALARALMRDAEVLVLDEPTASLDAEREYELFRQFQTLAEGKTALLISHRFSTVRMADRIAVLDEQHLTELGTHDELLARDGTYARLFNLQARGYRDGTDAPLSGEQEEHGAQQHKHNEEDNQHRANG